MYYLKIHRNCSIDVSNNSTAAERFEILSDHIFVQHIGEPVRESQTRRSYSKEFAFSFGSSFGSKKTFRFLKHSVAGPFYLER